MSRDAETRAVVLLSGGLDSATVLAKARADGRCCYALSVDYGQRHRAELDAAARLAARLGAVEHRVVHVDFGQFGGSALTDPALDVPTAPSAGIPITYVPARNTIMLALGLGWCEVLDAHELYIGVNAIDYSGYPDCRPDFIAAFGELARLATRAGVEGREFHVRTPLQHLTKGRHHQARAVAGTGLRRHRQLLPERRRRSSLRRLRRLSLAPRGFSRGRGR